MPGAPARRASWWLADLAGEHVVDQDLPDIVAGKRIEIERTAFFRAGRRPRSRAPRRAITPSVPNSTRSR